jgi:hypothetical protein
MGHVMSRFSRRAREPLRNHLLDQIDELALELRAAGEATSRGRVPLAARADYLRAADAHRRAVLAYAGAWGAADLTKVADGLSQCREALDASRALLEQRG